MAREPRVPVVVGQLVKRGRVGSGRHARMLATARRPRSAQRPSGGHCARPSARFGTMSVKARIGRGNVAASAGRTLELLVRSAFRRSNVPLTALCSSRRGSAGHLRRVRGRSLGVVLVLLGRLALGVHRVAGLAELGMSIGDPGSAAPRPPAARRCRGCDRCPSVHLLGANPMQVARRPHAVVRTAAGSSGRVRGVYTYIRAAPIPLSHAAQAQELGVGGLTTEERAHQRVGAA
jgi:hypothetical protein